MKRIVVLFSGRGTNLRNLIERLPARGIAVVAAITNRPEAGGIAVSREHGIPVEIVDHRAYATREAFDKVLVETIEHYAPDLTVTAGFMRMLTPVFTDRIRAINLHPSLLPKYKGARAIEQAFVSGDKICGISVHWVSAELDGGEVIAQASFWRTPEMDFDTFEVKIHELEYRLLPETVIELLGSEGSRIDRERKKGGG